MREEFIKIMQYSSFRQNEPPPPPCPDIIYYIHIYIEYRRELWENWSSPGVLEVMKGKYSNNNIRLFPGRKYCLVHRELWQPQYSLSGNSPILLLHHFYNLLTQYRTSKQHEGANVSC